jgi:hypothetical protein
VISQTLSLSLSRSSQFNLRYIFAVDTVLVRLPLVLLCLPVSWLVGDGKGFCASCGIKDIVTIY